MAASKKSMSRTAPATPARGSTQNRPAGKTTSTPARKSQGQNRKSR